MMNVEVDSTKAVARFNAMPQKMHDTLLASVYKWMILMQNYIRNDKLSGQVLNARSHKLQQSIQTEVEDGGTSIVGTVFSNNSLAPYNAIHEFGGVIPAHDIVASKAGALAFLWGGKQMLLKKVHIPDVTMPERSYMRSSLADKREEIIADIKQAAIDGAQE